jgi:MoxR-like ATPase
MKHIKIYEAFSPDEMVSRGTDLKGAIESSINNPSRESKPILIIGAPGTGVTSMVGKIATENSMTLQYIDAGQLSMLDSGLLPTDNRGGLLFFDDVDRASKEVLNSVMRFAINRKIEGYSLPDNWTVILSSSGEEGLYQLGTALESRFIIVSV